MRMRVASWCSCLEGESENGKNVRFPRDHPRNRFSPSIHFSATRKNSTHGTLWRLCARTARLVESCSKNNSLVYDVRVGRLVSSSRVASRPLAGQMTGTHVFLHWRMALILVCVVRLCWWEGEWESARGRKRRRGRRGRMATWPALCCFGGGSCLLFPFRKIPALPNVFLLLSFLLFFFSLNLT